MTDWTDFCTWIKEDMEPPKTSVVRPRSNEPPSSWRQPKLDVADFASIK